MSTFFSWQHAVRSADLEPTTKLVLYTIATYMAADGTGCFPSYATIADGSKLGRSTVIAHVKKAIEAGLLAKSTRLDDDGEHTSNLYRATMPEGGPLAGPPSPAPGPHVVQQRDPKKPSKQPSEHSPQPPRGPCGWEGDSGFMKVSAAYAKLNPNRVDNRKAWAVWQERGLSSAAEQILSALPYFAGLEQWTKEAGRFIPSLSKWLEDGVWRNAGKVSVQVSAEVLAEREKISKAGMRALARVESDRRLGLESSPADLEDLKRWQAMRSELSQVAA